MTFMTRFEKIKIISELTLFLRPLAQINLIIFLITFKCGTVVANEQDWTAYISEDDCLIMTTEMKKGNLSYPSTLFIYYNKSKNSIGAAVQNFEWLLKSRKSTVSFTTDKSTAMLFNVNLKNNLMSISDRAFIDKIELQFKRDSLVRLRNSRGKQVSEFSLMGFTKSFDRFKNCVVRNKPIAKIAINERSRKTTKYEINASTKDTVNFFLKAAVLFAIANGDIPTRGVSGSVSDIQVPDLNGSVTYKSSERNYGSLYGGDNNTTEIITGNSGTSYRRIGNTIRSSEGESWRRIGNTIRSSSGTTYRQIGNTIRSSDGESWRQIGNTIRSSSGTTWRRIGNTVRSSDGVTCRQIGTTTRCN